MTVFAFDPSTIRDISAEVLDDIGRPRVLPAAYWQTTTTQERFLLGAQHGIYGLPTVELVDRLTEIINGRTAIEIGAGHGVLADALGIPGTDNMEQADPAYRVIYRVMGQAPVNYGPHIVKMDAAAAVRHYRPQVVIGCWITQDHDGNDWKPGLGKLNGVDEQDVLDHCETYVLIGNQEVHQDKRIWQLPHTIDYPPYVFSRSINGSPDFLAVWQNRTAETAKTAAAA